MAWSPFSGPLLTPYDAFIDNDSVVTSSELGSASTAAILLTTFSLFSARPSSSSTTACGRGPATEVRAGRVRGSRRRLAWWVPWAWPSSATRSTTRHEARGIQRDRTAATGPTRLGSVGGQRSDLWRVAWDQFKDHPLAGAGAGSYQFAYFRDRHTDRNLSDAHSLPLRLLADTGDRARALLPLAGRGRGGRCPTRPSRRSRDRLWIGGLTAAATTVLAQCAPTGCGFFRAWSGSLPGSGSCRGRRRKSRRHGFRQHLEPRPSGDRRTARRRDDQRHLSLPRRPVRAQGPGRGLPTSGSGVSAGRTAAWFNRVSVTPLYLEAGALETEGHLGEAKRSSKTRASWSRTTS